MSVITKVRTVPRGAVRLGLLAARTPLSAAERVLRRGGQDGAWAPKVAYDGVEATVRQVAGSLLRDGTLVEQGRLQGAAVAQLRKATELETLAEAERRRSQQELQERRRRDEQKRAQAQKQAEQRKLQAQRDAVTKKQQAAQNAAGKERQAQKLEQAAQKSVARTERQARGTRVRAESKAVAAQRQAVEAQAEVLDLDRKIKASKQARKTG